MLTGVQAGGVTHQCLVPALWLQGSQEWGELAPYETLQAPHLLLFVVSSPALGMGWIWALSLNC